MDFNTHKRYAKLDDGVEDTVNKGVLVQDSPTPEVKVASEEEKLAKNHRPDTVLNAYSLSLPFLCRKKEKSERDRGPDEGARVAGRVCSLSLR